ncbi:hypothetical protein U9M48_026589 [Paspalum notatum var. saurae]|uniref:Uncharacterized protein n=1 Tax=Paspalum notatum var. saurae TaxID=547442 RepID=A0AAQ3TVK8_PASNO
MGDQGMPPYILPPPAAAAEVIGAAPVVVDHIQRRFLYAGRILIAGGWLVLTYYPAVGHRSANAEHAFIGIALLLLGAFMIMVAPVAAQFPAAARAGAAVADAVLSYFFVPADN